MYNIKFFYDDTSRFIEIENITFPTQFSDVMDGTFDTGSFEFVVDYNTFSRNMYNFLKEGNFIKREIWKDDTMKYETVFEIEEVNVEKDSSYDEKELKVTIRYVESTKFLTSLMMPNHTFSIYNYYIENTKETTNTNLYDVMARSIKMIEERNYNEYHGFISSYPFGNVGSRFRKMNLETLNPDLVKLLKAYPSKNRTYLDANFFDICKENFKDISSVPYYDALNTELTYIPSTGIMTNKKIDYDENEIVVSSSWNRNLSNNVDIIENKAVNIYEDQESVWYPMNIPLDNYTTSDSELTDPGNYTRPKGLNEGLEEYQYWYDWYLELPFNIERIEKLYVLKIGKKYNANATNEISGSNVWQDITNNIVEDSVYSGLTQTERKYFAHYKRGSNKIENVVVASGVTTFDDNWPWEKSKDNEAAFTTAFAVKYKPIINTDITVVKDLSKIKNKRNIVLANKNVSDADLFSQTRYELEKNFYSQYMLEIAGEYQDLFAGELVDINGFENYGIPSQKYLIYKVDTTFDKGGSHQIIYFNEMIAKNSVLLNENNLVRISQNPSYDSLIERVFKRTDAVKVSGVITNEIMDFSGGIPGTVNSDIIYANVMMALCPKLMGEVENTSLNDMYIKGISLKSVNYDVLENNVVPDFSEGIDESLKIATSSRFLVPTMNFFNAGTISQVIVKAINNYNWDNKGKSHQNTIKGGSGELDRSEPYRYTDRTGYSINFEMRIKNESPTDYLNNKIYGETIDYHYNTYYPEDTNGHYYKDASNMMPSIYFGEKDQREIFVGVYEQSFTGDEGESSQISVRIDLTDYFTSCTSCFMGELSNEQINIGHKLDKDILIFDKKIYNINSIDESKALKTIESGNYYDIISTDNYNIYIRLRDPKTNLPFIGNINEEADEYSFVIRGVLNTEVKDGINTSIKKVPQIVITVPKHIVKEEEYIRIDLSSIRL